MGSSPPVAEAAGIVKRFDSTVALDHAHITIDRGQTHALVGRNGAGKSTLVSIMTGLQAPERGTVRFGGKPAPRLADRDAWRRNVACVYQKSTIIPELTVAENLFLHRLERSRIGLVSWSAVRRTARQTLERWAVEVDVRLPARELTVEQRQFVEIARALSFGARFIILDEPTAQLDAAAIDRLFSRMRDLQEQGVTFLFISHHLQEVYDICDTVTVFRDAHHIVTAPVAELARGDLVGAMTGDAVGTDRHAVRRPPPSGTGSALRVGSLTSDAGYRDVSFDITAGEVVGLAGAAGSGRTELAETVAGLRAADSGTVAVAGVRLRPGSVPAALAAGVGFVPQDRHHQGYVPAMSIADNSTLTVPRRVSRYGFINGRVRERIARALIDALAIKTPGPDLPVAGLSGGNQQKVVMARALADSPKVLVLITPTAGVDVRSKDFLLRKVEETAAGGAAVLLASDELDDLRICDRVVVMIQGRVVAEIPRGWKDHQLVAAMEGVDLNA